MHKKRQYNVVVWGATGQAKVVRDALRGTRYTIVALFDNRQIPSPWTGVPIHYGMDAFDAWLAALPDRSDLFAVAAIGGDGGRDRLHFLDMFAERGLRNLSVRHPTAFVAHDATVGEGCQILAHAAVCAGVRMGKAVIANTACGVDHDCALGDGVHIGPGARLAGEVTVGRCGFVGAGAVLLPRLHIGENTIIGAGAVVTRNVPDGCVVAGNPARELRKR